MDDYKTVVRISSRSYTNRGIKTFVGRAHFYENNEFLWSETTGIHRLNAFDARSDATKLADEKLSEL